MQRHATEAAIVFLELEFLPARPAQKYVVDITRLLANEERGFLFLLALGHFMRILPSTETAFLDIQERVLWVTVRILASSIGLFGGLGFGTNAKQTASKFDLVLKVAQ